MASTRNFRPAKARDPGSTGAAGAVAEGGPLFPRLSSVAASSVPAARALEKDNRRTRKTVDHAVAAAVREFVAPRSRVAVALSGGLDSMVLLEALLPLAASHPFELSAVHVHHGLSPHADTWARFCTEQCSARGVRLDVQRVTLERKRARSLEATARAARYARLFASRVDVVALAHHADDQAETVLLQLLRGAGSRGLSAMPRFRDGKPALLRPLLGLTRAALRSYATQRGIAWIDDESNKDTRHKRNFLRHHVTPLLKSHFPGYPTTLVRTAELQAETSMLLDALASQDAAGACDANGLDQRRLVDLAPGRARNLLRWFLQQQGLKPPSQARLAELLRQLGAAARDSRACIGHEGVEIGCHRGRIAVHAPVPGAFSRVWHGELEVELPSGVLHFRPARGSGVSAEKLGKHRVMLRSRVGGERIQLAPTRPRRALKRVLQEARMPPWLREALPLVWCGEELVAVPGIGVTPAFRAAPGELSWELEWQTRDPAPRSDEVD